MNYTELKYNFFKEVGKIDVSKFPLGFNGLKDYAELLKVMAEIPEKTKDEEIKENMQNAAFSGFGSPETPKIEKGGK